MDVLNYSDEANATRYILLKDTNDINIFVEDKDKEYEYEPIINRMLDGKYKISSIFGVGGKPKLIERFHEFGTVDADNPSKINIYIADGDFDALLIPHDMITNDHFIYLETYNIETYYIDEDATIEYLCGHFKQRKCDVAQRVDFSLWINTIVSQLKKVFLCFCFVQKFCNSEKNVDIGPGYFIDEKTGFERKNAFERYLDNILIASNVTKETYDKEISLIEDSFNKLYGDKYLNLICGKYLLHSLYRYAESLLDKKNLNYDLLKWDLIRNFDVKKLEYIKNRIEKIVLKS